jgi:hypothetical protein
MVSGSEIEIVQGWARPHHSVSQGMKKNTAQQWAKLLLGDKAAWFELQTSKEVWSHV